MEYMLRMNDGNREREREKIEGKWWIEMMISKAVRQEKNEYKNI